MKTVAILTILAALCLTTDSRKYDNHLILKPGVFDLYWSVNTTNIFKTFYFKFVAKTTGWAAVGWSKTANGQQMMQYDVALGGVRNGSESYLKDYYSATLGKPDIDPSALQSLVLTDATESGGYTIMEFNRPADTGDTGNDVPLQNGTKTWIMWAIADKDATDSTTFVKHSDKGYTKLPYNMFTGQKFAATPDSSTTAKPSSACTSASSRVVMILSLTAVALFYLGTALMLQ